jgi:hypothetical protein
VLYKKYTDMLKSSVLDKPVDLFGLDDDDADVGTHDHRD